MLARCCLMLGLAGCAWACSCSDIINRPACEAFPGTGAVFLGTVISRNGPERMPSYSVEVREIFRGVPKGTRHVFVDPGFVCSRNFQLGETFLFYTRLPGTLGNPMYDVSGCTETKHLARAGEDLRWLREQRSRPQSTRVYGTVVQNRVLSSWAPAKDWEAPMPRASVTLEGDGRTHTILSGPDGSYSMEDIAPGRYRIWAWKDPWHPSQAEEVDLREGGCARRHLSVLSDGKVEGRVIDHNGVPRGDVSVEIVRRLDNGELAPAALAYTKSKTNGRFVLEPVPAGDFVLGVNLSSAPTEEDPYLPLAVQTLRLEPHQRITGQTVRLPAPIAARPVQVRVYWADGKPVLHGARAQAWHRDVWAGGSRQAHGNAALLSLLEGLEYDISADWFDNTSRPVFWIDSERVRLRAGRDPATVHIRLQWIEPTRR
ncbi:MAG: carboxypeptidase-like regulatory domain-containing protein [Bryobacteraceae bacterium]